MEARVEVTGAREGKDKDDDVVERLIFRRFLKWEQSFPCNTPNQTKNVAKRDVTKNDPKPEIRASGNKLRTLNLIQTLIKAALSYDYTEQRSLVMNHI
ncbi:hypothetical protein L596_002163 [Steinernema carpocapsae]|uniref:Uncharacterized protein n=1 Tax=Steinernema carpocapsae TaxID=34508 RepID=A0A4U8USD3_STECR|nr:hypothetical protein L596_002163 [Steinernema carpocapsae]